MYHVKVREDWFVGTRQRSALISLCTSFTCHYVFVNIFVAVINCGAHSVVICITEHACRLFAKGCPETFLCFRVRAIDSH